MIDDFGSLSYAALVEQVERIAAFLQDELAVRLGDRVLLYLPNGRGWIAAYFAILRINAVVVPVNPMNKAEELKGKAKEGLGDATDNERLQAEGQGDQAKASAKQAGEHVKDAAKDVFGDDKR